MAKATAPKERVDVGLFDSTGGNNFKEGTGENDPGPAASTPVHSNDTERTIEYSEKEPAQDFQ
jgi:hypothetical protein